jgi:uracil-DNA glycosylase
MMLAVPGGGQIITIGQRALVARGRRRAERKRSGKLGHSQRGGGLDKSREFAILNQEIIHCRKCPRLVRYREQVARTKRRAFMGWTYWGRPVPGFGDPGGGLLILGLAPAAHGANRTGRMFTGDRSGDFLYRALHRAGFANQTISVRRDDGLALSGAFITATIRCAPPGNKPLPSEIRNCRPYLEREFELLHPRAVLALGGVAFRNYLALLKEQGAIPARGMVGGLYKFRHGASYQLPHGLPAAPGLPRLFASYHPSQQNTFTGKLTQAMLARILRRIRRYLAQVAWSNA